MTERARVRFLALGAIVLAGFALLLFLQQRALQDLRAENALLRAKTTAADAAARAEPTRAPLAPEDAAELQRLRASQSELLKLRGEVATLRRQLKELQAAGGVPAPPASEDPAPEKLASPVDTYAARVHATVAWEQTLVTGGWILSSGKRGVILIRPQLGGAAGQPGQFALQTRIAEMPEEVFSQVGLVGVDGKQSSSQTILTPEQADNLVKALGRTEGVDLISAPKINMLDGRAAQVKVAETRSISGETYETGPLVDIIPQISPDGGSVDLSVLAQLRLPVKTGP